MAVDLHTHSTASDGSETPATVVRLAKAAGLRAVALTDHDNMDGIAEATAAGVAAGIDVIPGTELSVEWDGGAMHLLVYFLDPGPGPLQDAMAAIRSEPALPRSTPSPASDWQPATERKSRRMATWRPRFGIP